MKKNLPIVLTGTIALAVGLLGGYYFRNYQLTKFRGKFIQEGQQRFNGQMGGSQNGNRMVGFRPTEGEILSIDEKGLTIKLPDGSSKIIIFSESTNINKSIVGAKSDLKVNSKVLVSGTANSDGSITASSLQLIDK